MRLLKSYRLFYSPPFAHLDGLQAIDFHFEIDLLSFRANKELERLAKELGQIKRLQSSLFLVQLCYLGGGHTCSPDCFKSLTNSHFGEVFY